MRHPALTIKRLQQEGLPVTPGNAGIPRRLLSAKTPTLADVRRRLAKFHGSLAEEIARLRQTE